MEGRKDLQEDLRAEPDPGYRPTCQGPEMEAHLKGQGAGVAADAWVWELVGGGGGHLGQWTLGSGMHRPAHHLSVPSAPSTCEGQPGLVTPGAQSSHLGFTPLRVLTYFLSWPKKELGHLWAMSLALPM